MDTEIRGAESPPGQHPALEPGSAPALSAVARGPGRAPGPPALLSEWQLQRTKEVARLVDRFEQNFRSSLVASGLFDQIRAASDSLPKISGPKISVSVGVRYHPASTQRWVELTRPQWAFLTGANGAANRAASAAVMRSAWATVGPAGWAGQSSILKTIEAMTSMRFTQWQPLTELANPAWSKILLDNSLSAGAFGIRSQDLQRVVRTTVLGDAAARTAAMRLASTFRYSQRPLPNIAPLTPYTGIRPPFLIGPTPAAPAPNSSLPAAPAPDSTLPILDDEGSTSGLERLLRTRIREIALVLVTVSGACNALGVALLMLANEPLANILTVLFGEGTLLLAVPPSVAAIRQLRSGKTTT
jgi:hypothetical protein